MSKHPDLADSGVPFLLPQHQEMLKASAISEAVQLAREYNSVVARVELRRIGFNEGQSRCVPALTFPIWKPCGEKGLYQMRPDKPRAFSDGHSAKYEMPAKERLCLDVPPTVRQHIGNPKIPLFVTEGVKKGDALASVGACTVTLLGVTCWRGTSEHSGKVALPEWNDVALNDREIVIVFDSDVMRKLSVYLALRNVKAYLEHRGSKIYLVYLPSGKNSVKMGVDDYLASGKTLDDVLHLMTKELKPPPEDENRQKEVPYEETARGLVWFKPTRDGENSTPLTNFTARIMTEVVEDDGTEQARAYRIDARRNERHACFTIPASAFETMTWPAEHLGASAFVYPGMTLKDHARVAIRALSGEPPEQRVYTHTGWRQLEEERWVYLHAGGAIGNDTPEETQVRLTGTLKNYALPEPPGGEPLRVAVQACLNLCELADERIILPLLAGVFRAAIKTADFSLCLVGPSGAFKSELASLAQRFYGRCMDANNLPGSWSSTPNALEELAFRVKDALLVIDDFAPTGSAMDVQRLHAAADRVLRAQGNGSGRQRMRRDGSLPQPRPPRGLILSTGEDVPAGKSLKARMFIMEVGPGEINKEKLTECQQQAARGVYALCMAGFLDWLAPRYEEVLRAFPDDVKRLRQQAHTDTMHLRTPETVAELCVGFSYFLNFARDNGAIQDAAVKGWAGRCWKALMDVAHAQAVHQQASDPVNRFLDLLRSAISSGKAHIATPKGFHPHESKAWGWHLHILGVGENERDEWRPQGDRIGWVKGDNLYLQKDASFNLVKRLGNESGEGVTLTQTQLFKRLFEARMLVSTDTTRQTLLIRKTMEGKPQLVLHLRASTIVQSEPDKPDNSDEEADEED